MSETVRKKGATGYVLLAPGMIWLTLFFLIPFYSLLAASLFNKGGSDFRGYSMVYEWSNYSDVIKAYWPQIVRSGSRPSSAWSWAMCSPTRSRSKPGAGRTSCWCW